MKKLAIYFSDPEPMGDPFNSPLPYWQIYQEIIRDIEVQGVEVYIVRASYLGNGVFSHGWQVRNKALVSIDHPIKVDLIFHRGSQATIPATYDCPIINHPDLERFCGDKARILEAFPDISPKTKAINSYQQFIETIKEWGINPEEKIVLKKNFLYGGHGIYIRPITEMAESLYEDWQDVLVQEFVDSSVGIPHVVNGLHDIRIVIINAEPVYSFVRTPKPGSFLANITQGGTGMPVELDLLPSSLFALVDQVNKKLAQYKPSIFAADFFNSKDGFKLVELNSRPGLLPYNKKFNAMIVQLMVTTLNSLT